MKLNHMLAVLGLFTAGSPAWADPPQPPKNVNVEPTTPKSAALTSRAASAEMTGNPQAALKLAERAIAANPRDPWGYYDKAMALAQVGQLDRALDAFGEAEQRYSATDRWGKSVAIYGRAHALSEAGRCDEAKKAFRAYSSLIREQDPKSAGMATKYAIACRSPIEAPVAAKR
jgi:tetratricopeptide (TPR) repeat protein